MSSNIKAGIVGGAGYTGGELLRILINHPKVDIHFVQSRSHSGQPYEAVHEDLSGDETGIFVEEPKAGADVIFLCMGHNASKEYLQNHTFDKATRIIDLSQDFRHSAEGNDFVYGLPELNRESISKAQRVANPGCFATCITLGLLPLAKLNLLQDDVHITGITGSTGAGQSLSPTSHFSWRDNNLSVYKPFDHQHLKEIGQSLRQLQPSLENELVFIPVRGNFSRGIMVSSVVKTNLEEREVYDLYQDFYKEHPFTAVTRTNPHLKQVVNTNKSIVHLQKNNGRLLIISMIDNLLKGASGQAVQNMNLMFGLEETMGLKLKGSAF